MAYQSKNTDEHVTFADALLSKRYRKAQNDFLNQVDTLIDWRPIRTLINKKYTKRQNAIGAPAYDVILLFKMLLLETQGNRIKNFEKIQVANFQMIAFRRLYSKIKNVLKTMIDNQALTF